MIDGPMVAKRTAPKVSAKSARVPTNRLSEAARQTERMMLLTTLQAVEWNLSAAARVLGFSQPTHVRHAIRRLGLTEEFAAATGRPMAPR